MGSKFWPKKRIKLIACKMFILHRKSNPCDIDEWHHIHRRRLLNVKGFCRKIRCIGSRAHVCRSLFECIAISFVTSLWRISQSKHLMLIKSDPILHNKPIELLFRFFVSSFRFTSFRCAIQYICNCRTHRLVFSCLFSLEH